MTTANPRRFLSLSMSNVGVLLILFGHLLAGTGMLLLMPGGFAVSDRYFWAFRVVPAIVAIALLLAMSGRPKSWAMPGDVLVCLSAAWMTLAVASPFIFRFSWPRLSLISLLAGLAMTQCARLRFERRARFGQPRFVGALLVGVSFGTVALAALRAPRSSTRPSSTERSASFTLSNTAAAERANLRLNSRVALDTTGASVSITSGRRIAWLEPLLTFDQRSPDGCWTILADRIDRARGLQLLRGTSITENAMEATYAQIAIGQQLTDSRLRLRRIETGYEIDVATQVLRETWSHLNHYAQLVVAGHRKLRVCFSPAPETLIDVTCSDYPFGRPARFAFVDADGTFKIVEASNAEKGPFHVLASGPIGEGPLTIMLYDDQSPFLELTLRDWARQTSRELSPAAGWGVPQNAIEFNLDQNADTSPATFHITLAATSVGRGWASVGHAAGVYQNRISLRVIE